MTDLDTLILEAVQHTPVSTVKLRHMLQAQVNAEARNAGARPSDVLAKHLLRLNDAGCIRFLAKADGWARVNTGR